jgi:hypothetical protein
MQPYKEYFLTGSAKMIHPFNRLCYPAGSVLKPGRLGSIVEVTRFELPSFTMSMAELAEWFGLELARLIVDEYLDG